MVEIKNVPGVPDEVRRIFDPFLKEFIAQHKDNVVSVFLYGSAAGPDFIPGVSDINSVAVVKTISLDLLQKSLRLVASGKRKRIQAPLILTLEHIRLSLDVFPIEFLDMKDHYAVLYGRDVLQEISVESGHVRLFCEQQLKGRLIRIRQAYLEVGLKRRGIEALLKESLGSLFPVFRALIRMKGIPVPVDKAEILKVLQESHEIDLSAMAAIWKDKRNDERIAGRDVREVFGTYIEQLETLAQTVDRL